MEKLRHDRKLIELLFTGKNVQPGEIRSHEIANIIIAVEDMVGAIIARDFHVNKDQVTVGLTGISRGSLGLQFVPDYEIPAFQAFEDIAHAVESEDYRRLPSEVLTSLRTIRKFSRKYRCDVELRTNNGRVTTHAIITPETEISLPPPLKGETVIYGRVTRVGGKKPRVQFDLINGKTIYCDASEDMARRLGARLYKSVGLVGIATWEAEGLEIKDFDIVDILNYKDKPITAALDNLKQAIGKYYDDIEDVEGYVDRLRSD